MVSCPQIKIFYGDELTQVEREVNNFLMKNFIGTFEQPQKNVKIQLVPVVRVRSKGAGGVMIRTTGSATGTQSESLTTGKTSGCSDGGCPNDVWITARNTAWSRTITLNTHIIGDYDSVLRLPRESGIAYLHDTFSYFRWLVIITFTNNVET